MTECNRCGKCCKYIAVKLAGKIPDDTVYMMEVRGRLVRYEGVMWWVVRSRCPHLSMDGSCSIYETRPKDCRIYPAPGDWRPEGCTL